MDTATPVIHSVAQAPARSNMASRGNSAVPGLAVGVGSETAPMTSPMAPIPPPKDIPRAASSPISFDLINFTCCDAFYAHMFMIPLYILRSYLLNES